MARYIDADTLKERIEYYFSHTDAESTRAENYAYSVALKEIDKTHIADVVEVVRCGQCKHSRQLEKNVEMNREHYLHCAMLRGEDERVWVKYKRYYKDYSIVECDDYCSYGERKCEDGKM